MTDADTILENAGPTMSVTDAAKILNISRAHAYMLIEADQFPVRIIRLGKKIAVPTAALRRALNGLPPETEVA